MKILCFGEILFDVFGNEAKIGGAPFNFAAHAARAGAKSYLVSAVGEDDLAQEAIRKVKHHGVSDEYIGISQKYGTGVCRVTLDGAGVPQYELVEPVAYDDICFDRNIADTGFDALYFGTLALRGESNRQALRKIVEAYDFEEIFVDVNVRHPFCKKEALTYALESATVIKISDEELAFVMKEALGAESIEPHAAARMIAQRYEQIKLVLITCGANGSFVYDAHSTQTFCCPAHKTEVVSTVGAGDSFAATFLVNRLRGEGILECMKKASAVSAYVVSHIEAIPK